MAQRPCPTCLRDFTTPESASENASASFFLSVEDMRELRVIKDRSFTSGAAEIMFLKKDIVNNSRGEEMANILVKRTDVVERHSSLRAPSYLTQAWRFLTRSGKESSLGVDERWTHYNKEKTVIRTMPDRQANMNDLVWIIRQAGEHRIGMNAFLLHSNSFVWISIKPPRSRRTEPEEQRLMRDSDRVLMEDLQKLKLRKENFAEINELLIGTGSIAHFAYPRGAVGVPARIDVGLTCTTCRKLHAMPASAIRSPLEKPDAIELKNYFLTNGDMVALIKIKERSYYDKVPRVGFIDRVLRNASAEQELAHRVVDRSLREVEQKDTSGWMSRLMSKINILGSSTFDELWLSHRGESTLFRTMPDRPANIKDLVWVVEAARERQMGMNAFFLHEKHFLWVAIFPFSMIEGDNDLQKVLRSADSIKKKLLGMKLNKASIPAVRKALGEFGSVAYHTYLPASWMDSINASNARRLLMVILAGEIGFMYASRWWEGDENYRCWADETSTSPALRLDSRGAPLLPRDAPSAPMPGNTIGTDQTQACPQPPQPPQPFFMSQPALQRRAPPLRR